MNAVRGVTLHEHAMVKGNSGNIICNLAMIKRDGAECSACNGAT